MKSLADWLFGRNRRCSYGRMLLLTKYGKPLTVSKEIRYNVRCNGSEVHINSYDYLISYCKASEYTTSDSNPL